MGWITKKLGYGLSGTIDADNPTNPPQVSQGPSGSDPWQVVVVAATAIQTNNLVSVPASVEPVMLLPVNDNRKVLSIYNKSDAKLWIKFGSGVSNVFFNFELPKNSFWESEFYSWNGEVWGVWSDTTGHALVSELT